MHFYTSDGCSYFGMDQDTVLRLRTELGKESVFISKMDFDILVQSRQGNS